LNKAWKTSSSSSFVFFSIPEVRIQFYKLNEVTPKSLLFLSAPIASKHSDFPLTEVSASEVPAILTKFVSKEATSEAAILKLSCKPGSVYVVSFRPVRNWREGEKPATDLASFTGSAKSIFPSDYPFHYLRS